MLDTDRSQFFLARIRPALLKARYLDALRTIQESKRSRLSFALKPATPFSLTDPSSGILDIVEVSDGSMRVAGWSRHEAIQIRTERDSRFSEVALERVDVPAEYGAKGFDITLIGSDALGIDIDGVPIAELDLRKYQNHRKAWIETLFRLVQVPVRHGVSFFKYAVLGDVEAGRVLDAFLVPTKYEPSIVVAGEGLFRSSASETEEPDPVDIILPVYNAFEDVKECLTRLNRFTAPTHRIIIVDDASTDERIPPLLAEFVSKHPNADLVRAPKNRGFIHSVNTGFSKATRDVVLLNSDAFVPEGWLARLMAPMQASSVVASVTPLTNNGEIASAPVICKAAELPEGTPDAIDRALRSLDPVNAVTQVPTGVGFCMAISRAWLDKVPEFDLTFGAGYGEEVDWCRKVIARGGRHLLTGALFVEHRGGSSFGPEKLARVQENNRRISKRYPKFDADVQTFIRSDPAIGQRLAVALAQAGLTGRVPVYLGHRMGGGAELWLQEQVDDRNEDDAAAVVVRDGDKGETALLEVHLPGKLIKGNVPAGELTQYLQILGEKSLVYSCLVGARDPIKLIEAAAGALSDSERMSITFHDYFPLCPSHNLLGWNNTFCNLPDDATCTGCFDRLPSKLAKSPESIGKWRSHWERWLGRADEVLVFSASSQRLVSKVFPQFESKIVVKPHTMSQLPAPVRPPKQGPPVVGVLGAIGFPKGAQVLKQLADVVGDELKIVIIGEIDPTYAHPNIRVHGRYERHEVSMLAKRYGIDRWFLPSICPETFSFTTQECLATGLPVYVFDLGAPADIVGEHKKGRVLPLGLAPEELIEALRADLSNGQDNAARAKRSS